MSRFGFLLLDPDSKDFNKSVVEAMHRLLEIVDNRIEFGNPHDPRLDTSTTRAGDGHNGVLSNVYGSWVDIVLDDATNLLNTNVECVHNLDVPVFSASEPNVLWLVFGFTHDGTGTGAGSTVSVGYIDGTVAANSIELRFYAAARTVTVGSPLLVRLFFIPGVRG